MPSNGGLLRVQTILCVRAQDFHVQRFSYRPEPGALGPRMSNGCNHGYSQQAKEIPSQDLPINEAGSYSCLGCCSVIGTAADVSCHTRGCQTGSSRRSRPQASRSTSHFGAKVQILIPRTASNGSYVRQGSLLLRLPSLDPLHSSGFWG